MTRARAVLRLAAAMSAFALLAAACSDSGPAATPTTTTVVTTTTAAPTTTAGPLYHATIRRTENNVPHILADDMGSLGFGYGYAISEDHLCTLADVVNQVNSEQAKYHGPDALPQDVVYKAIDLMGNARAEFDAMDAELQSVIRGYAGRIQRLPRQGGGRWGERLVQWCRLGTPDR